MTNFIVRGSLGERKLWENVRKNEKEERDLKDESFEKFFLFA